MMGNIFASAAFVLAWIGPEYEDSAVIFTSLGSSRVANSWVRLPRQLDGALYPLSRREYWKRVWIIQKIVLAQDVVIACGEELLLLKSLTSHPSKEEVYH